MTPIFKARPVSSARLGLTKFALGIAGALALLTAAPGMASIINFEDQDPWVYNGGEVLMEAGYQLQVLDNHDPFVGQAGGIANGMDPTTCALGGCPSGNLSHFYVGANDGSVVLTRIELPTFMLKGLDYAFMAPLGGQLPGASYGQLQLSGAVFGGGTISSALDFPGIGSDGNPMFSAAALSQDFLNATLTSLTIRACVYDDGGSCINPQDGSPFQNQAQFAIDNLSLAEVPEPGSFALLGLGMGALTLIRRRKSTASSNNA
jgi:hypothetical protein